MDADAQTPSSYLFADFKGFGGISNGDLARMLLSDRRVAGGLSPRDRVGERTFLSREVVHARPGHLPEAMFAPFPASARAVCERLVARLGPGAPAAIERHVAEEAAPGFRAALRAWGANDTLYANALARVRSMPVQSDRGRSVALLVLYLATACLGDSARAVQIVKRFAAEALGSALRTRAADVGEAPATWPGHATLALVRVVDGRLEGGFHPLRADAAGTVIGSLAPDPGAIVDVGPDVSGRHLRIWREGDRWLAEGLGSTFGTVLVPGDGGPERVVEPPSATRGPSRATEPVEVLPGDTLRLAAGTEFLVLEVAG